MRRLMLASLLMVSACGLPTTPTRDAWISVYAKDAATNAPIAGARAEVVGLPSVMTDVAGAASILTAKGKQRVCVWATAYKPACQDVTVEHGASFTLSMVKP